MIRWWPPVPDTRLDQVPTTREQFGQDKWEEQSKIMGDMVDGTIYHDFSGGGGWA